MKTPGLLVSISKKVLLTVILQLYLSCILKDIRNINIILPEIPAEWKYAEMSLEAEIRYFSEGKTKVISGLDFGNEVEIEIEKITIPFTAYPLLKNSEAELRPAGGIFPENCNGKALVLSWENGFAAELMLKLCKQGVDFCNFNTGRFEDLLLKISEGNPWKISESAVLYSLAYGIFNSNYISLLKPLNIEMNHSFLSGEWVLADPLDSRIISSAGSLITLNNIYPGYYLLVKKEEELKYAEIFIEKNKWTAFFSSGAGGLSESF